MNPRPRPRETLGEYIDRVIVGEKPKARHERPYPLPDFSAFELGYVYAPYVPLVATRPIVWSTP